MTASADLVVIGGGVVGMRAATFARELGLRDVVVLEAETVGSGASSRAAGIVRTQGGTVTAVDLARWTVAFYSEQAERYGFDSDFRQLGYLILAFDEVEADAARERVSMHNLNGLASRWVSAAEAADLLPGLDPAAITGATFCGEDGAIDPPRNVAAALVALRAATVDLRERTPARGLVIDGGRVTGVRTDAGTIRTDRVILAGGVQQPALSRWLGGRVPIGAARHQVAVTAPLPATGPVPMAFDIASGLYWRQAEGGFMFGMSNPVERPGEATEIDFPLLERIRERLAELMPMTRGLALRKTWAATIDYSPDHLPVLGCALDAEGAQVGGVILASAAGHGMMWGPAVARAAADLVVHGRTSVTDVSRLGADRFDADGRSSLATDPIALPFPTTIAVAS